ncbi:MAG: hypothetical protein ACI4SH_06545, partial [Candidatus Scatosoma sp.]
NYLAPEQGKTAVNAGKEAETSVFDLPRVSTPALSYEEARRAMNAMSETPKKPLPPGLNLPFSVDDGNEADERENERINERENARESERESGNAPQNAGQNGTERQNVPAIEESAYSAAEQGIKNRSEKAGNRARGKRGALFDMFPDLSVDTPIVTLNSSAGAAQGREETDRGATVSPESYDAFEENKKFLLQREEAAKAQRVYLSSFTYAGKLFNTYLLYEREDEVLMIDQHAAHERLIYNRFTEKMRLRQTASQSMLIPYALRVNACEKQFLHDNLENIRAIGFEIGETDDGFSVSAVPADLTDIDLSAFFAEILNGAEGYRAIKIEDLLRDKLATAACKAAVKGGDDLSEAEIKELFRLINGNFGLRCPHGRPVVVRITRSELEKMFKRIV